MNTELNTLLKKLDKRLEEANELSKLLEEDKNFLKLRKVQEEVTTLKEQLKSMVESEGEFSSRYIRFSQYNKTQTDYKSIVTKLLEKNIISESVIRKFTKHSTVTQAAAITVKAI